MSAQKHLQDMAALYPNFKVNPSKLSGDLKLDTHVLKVDTDAKPEEWKVLESATGNFLTVANVKGAEKLAIAEFIETYKDIDEDVEGNVQEVTVKAPVEPENKPEEVVQEPMSDADKLAMLDEIMDGKVEPVKPAPTKALAKKNVQKAPFMVPFDVRSKQIAELTNSDIINYLCPKATEKEAMIFLKVCQAKGINPFLKEAYLVKYKAEDPASIVVAKDYFARKAEEHPMYDGEESGIILMSKDGGLERREGAFMLPNENVVGGWCKVYRKDRARPVLTEVAFHEYVQKTREGTPNKFWNKMSATMIQKVAFSQCHRKAFPGEFSGLYDSSEIEGSMEGLEESVIEASYEEVEA